MKKGTIFDERYEVLCLLGEGGMGSVYKAKELGLGRQVALKVLHPSLCADGDSRARFHREGQILSGLSHKNIITFFRFGFWEESPYIVMELLQGRCLSDLVGDGRRMTWKRALAIGAQIAEAMAYAHQHNVVHRDLKPNNIMLLEAPAADTVKILDFGLARFSGGFAADQRLTQTGALVGSVYYISPEQAGGRPADARSDIYSLACLLFEAIGGEPLFMADNPVGLLHKHASEKPRLISQLVPDVPQALDDVLAKALEKSPDKRYQSMEDFADELRQILSDGSSACTVAKFRRQQRNKIAGAVAFLLASALAVFAFSEAGIGFLSATAIKVIASQEVVSRGVDFADHLTDEGKTEAARTILASCAGVAKQLDDSLLPIEIKAGQAKVAARRGEAWSSMHLYRETLTQLWQLEKKPVKQSVTAEERRIAFKVFKGVAGIQDSAYSRERSTSIQLNKLIERYANNYDWELAIAGLQADMKFVEKTDGANSYFTAVREAKLAGFLDNMNRKEEASMQLCAARRIAERTTDEGQVADIYSQVAAVEVSMKRWQEALKDNEIALEHWHAFYAACHRKDYTAEVAERIAITAMSLNRPDQAIPLLRAILETDDVPRSTHWAARRLLAEIYLQREQFTEAKKVLEPVPSIDAAKFPAGQYCALLNLYATALERTAMPDKAAEVWKVLLNRASDSSYRLKAASALAQAAGGKPDELPDARFNKPRTGRLLKHE